MYICNLDFLDDDLNENCKNRYNDLTVLLNDVIYNI